MSDFFMIWWWFGENIRNSRPPFWKGSFSPEKVPESAGESTKKSWILDVFFQAVGVEGDD